MSLIDTLAERLTRHPKRVVFPEGSDPRILQAARQFATRRLGVPILLGDRTVIKENAARLDLRLDGLRILEPARADEFPEFVQKFQGLRRFKGLDEHAARDYVANNNYFAAIMLATMGADAVVAGATQSAASGLRPLFQVLPLQDGVTTASSLAIVETSQPHIGINGHLFLADCGVLPSPSMEQLADIAVTTAALANHLTDQTPRVAMLAYSTKSRDPKNPTIGKIQGATKLAHRKAVERGLVMEIDGEMQLDAALDPVTAKQKGVDSSVAGRANVLVFPDLNSGNITLKTLQIVSNARTYGQIITGLSRPAAEISRSASAHDIFGTAVLVAAQAVDKSFLYAHNPPDAQG
ncbi:MAG TPA: phosphate acyltransferase [Opitutales bacterium]|nr:phosphate acyltransferase [Opitutales bacterium]